MVLCKLDSLVKNDIDPLQLAYRSNRSTDDAVLYVLENIHSHLEGKKGSFVQLMSFNLSLEALMSHVLQ